MNIKTNNLITLVLFFIISFSITLYFIGPYNFWFYNTNWLYGASDLTNSQISWQYFQKDDWGFPFGKNPNYGLEIANSIIYTDNIPFLAFFFKTLNFLLPDKFQYFGLWVLICIFLQLFFSHLIVLKATNDRLFSFLSSFLFLLIPFFFFRLSHHFALGAHWLILYAFYIGYFADSSKKKLHWFFLINLSILIHLYFTVMIFIIYSFFLLEEIIEKKNLKKIFSIFYLIIYSLLLMYIVGYFESSPINSVSSGYGIYKIDLLSFFDSGVHGFKPWSLFLKELGITHLEGFIYIGLGNILLIITSIFVATFSFKNDEKNNIKFFRKANLYVIFFAIWALTTNFSINGVQIFNINLNNYVYGLLSIFSSTGRFAWPIIYIFIFFSSIWLFINLNKKFRYLLLFFFIIIQLSDISIGLKNNSFKNYSEKKINPIWNKIEKEFEEVRTTYLFNNYGPLFNKFSNISGNLNNIKTDIILNAAYDRRKAAEVRYNLIQKVKNKQLNNKTAYIIDNVGHLIQLKYFFEKQDVGFFFRDNLWIMLPNKKKEMQNLDKEKFDQIKLKTLEINKKHIISFKEEFLGFGWTHNFNKNGAWTEGSNAYLNFKLPNSKKNLELILNLKPYKSNNNENFELDIFLNNNFIKKINLYNNKQIQNITLPINKNLLDDEIFLNLKINNSISPYDVFESPDARKLGVLLNSLEIKEKL